MKNSLARWSRFLFAASLTSGLIGGALSALPAAAAECSQDVCVGDRAYNAARNHRPVAVIAIDRAGGFVLRFTDDGDVSGGWSRWDLALPWGCHADLCVNDTVYNVVRGREARIVAIQTARSGAEKFVLRYPDTGGIGGGWDAYDLALVSRGPVAYPPNRPRCPPGTSWDPYTRRCEPYPRSCPPGYRWDPVRRACVRVSPRPDPRDDWRCTIQRGTRVFNGYGDTRGEAMAAVLRGCSNAGYHCRASEAYCRQ